MYKCIHVYMCIPRYLDIMHIQIYTQVSIHTNICVCIMQNPPTFQQPNSHFTFESSHFAHAPVLPLPVPMPIQHFDWPALAPSDPAICLEDVLFKVAKDIGDPCPSWI